MRPVSLAFLALLAACDGGVGTIAVSAWGEEAARDGFAADELADGWTIALVHDVIAIGDVRATSPRDGARVGALDGAFVIDAARLGAPAALGAFEAPAGRVDLDFALTPPSADATAVGGADAALVAELAERGWSVLLEGSGTKDGVTKTFRWGFALDQDYTRCENGLDGTAGVAVVDGAATPATLTVHADHPWWDRLGTEEAELRFQAIADADADADGAVTLDELAAVRLADLGYETSGLDLDDLGAFVRASVAMSPHLNGEGLCRSRPR